MRTGYTQHNFVSLPGNQLRSQSQSSNHRPYRFPGGHIFHRFHQTCEFHPICQTHGKKTKLLEKFKLPEKRGFELTEKKVPSSWPTLICKLLMASVVWNISTGQLGLAPWLCSLPTPAHLLIS